MKTVIPATPYDAKGLLIAAIEDNDPTIFFEPKRIYNGPFDGYWDRPSQNWSKHPAGEVPTGYYKIELGKAKIVRAGEALTILAYGTMVHVCAAVVAEAGIDAEIVDEPPVINDTPPADTDAAADESAAEAEEVDDISGLRANVQAAMDALDNKVRKDLLVGKPGYEVTDGEILFRGEDLVPMDPETRAREGVFLAFQYPVEILGVGNMTFLRTAVNAQRKARGEEEMSAAEFLKVVRAKAKTLKIDADMLKRPVNVGFSGGEKKRNEILQMAMLEPKMCILDETDSGLDVDAMKLVSEGVNALRSEGRSFLVITHYQRLLDHIKPDVVHIMANGRIIKSGGPELALEVEQNGYADILAEVS